MPYMLSDRHFAMVVGLAFLLHLSAFVAWSVSPKQAVQEISIRSMNIRLGDGDDTPPEAMNELPAAPATNAPQVEAIIDQVAQEAAKPQPQAPADGARQYVRETNMPRAKTTEKKGKGGAKDAEIMSRYTQMISLWIQKFKVYPEEARQQGLKGSTVVRIRIDRRGNIRYYALERSTGIEALDKAALDMIKRANPVPAVPADYPEGESFEFLVPVNFSLL